jgi:succinate-acetate transporter protein
MNDNDKPSDTEAGLFEIIETFAPGYHAALAMFATTQREVMVLKLVIVAALVTALSFVVVNATNINSVTSMAGYIAVVLSVGLWRIFRIEGQLKKSLTPHRP